MADETARYRGCLLGLAVGDAMGYAVDGKRLEDIRRDYGPNGLLGYDLVNGYADVSSYTQLAAYTANGLLVGATHGQLQGRMAPFLRYIAMAQREWGQAQQLRREPERPGCWISRVPELRRRRCMDTRMLDTLRREPLGTLEEPRNRFDGPGAITAAVAVGLFFQPERMAVPEVGRLGAEAIALTHGAPIAFLSGGVLAYAIAGILQDPATALPEQLVQAAEAVAAQFRRAYPMADSLRDGIVKTVHLAADGDTPDYLERLACDTSEQVLLGAVYAVLTCRGDFDAAMITAVNHSGRSAAVGAVAGAILGAVLGEEALPEFYLESLEPRAALTTLADDLVLGCPMERATRLFDDDWDNKYIQAQNVPREGWYETD